MASHTAVETLKFKLAGSSQMMGPTRSASQELIQKPASAPLGFLDPLAEKWINSAQVYDDSLRKERTLFLGTSLSRILFCGRVTAHLSGCKAAGASFRTKN